MPVQQADVRRVAAQRESGNLLGRMSRFPNVNRHAPYLPYPADVLPCSDGRDGVVGERNSSEAFAVEMPATQKEFEA